MIEELGMDAVTEVESEWMVMLLVELKRGRLMAWQLGVSFYSFGGGIEQRSSYDSPC